MKGERGQTDVVTTDVMAPTLTNISTAAPSALSPTMGPTVAVTPGPTDEDDAALDFDTEAAMQREQEEGLER